MASRVMPVPHLRAGAGPAPPKGVPWHFKLMLVALAGYMVYRIYWLAEWLPRAPPF